MKINVIENKAQRLVLELEGADHTFCNALKDEMHNDENVSISTYTLSHPLTGKPKFIIETKKGTKPNDAVTKAVDALKKKNNEFLKAYKGMK